MSKKVSQRAPIERPQSLHTVDLNELPLVTLEDYKAYNREARRAGMPVKVPPAELHEQVKVKFDRFNQRENVLKFYVRNIDIDYKGQLKPGNIYTLPRPVVKFLNNLSVPIYGEVQVNDGGSTRVETQQIGEQPRFSCREV